MAKGIWLGNIHIDVTDDATERDIEILKTFAQDLQAKKQQRQVVFNNLWLAAQKGDRDTAWKWFDIGCDWIEQKQLEKKE